MEADTLESYHPNVATRVEGKEKNWGFKPQWQKGPSGFQREVGNTIGSRSL